MICGDCGLPDPYDGDGDGIGSCMCLRCEDCGQPEWICGYCSTDEHKHWPRIYDTNELDESLHHQ